jgi:uncharacterized OsmC-like protein
VARSTYPTTTWGFFGGQLHQGGGAISSCAATAMVSQDRAPAGASVQRPRRPVKVLYSAICSCVSLQVAGASSRKTVQIEEMLQRPTRVAEVRDDRRLLP